MKTSKVAIIGGGISGLSTAFFLKNAFRKNNIPAELSVYEGGNRFGGVIQSHHKEGFTYEEGPDTFISEKPWAVDLCRQLGLDSELIGVRTEHQRSAMVYRGRLYPIPKGFYLMASPSLKTLGELPFVSWKGKLRMMMEPLIPKRVAEEDDESVASFIRRRLGEEALWRIGQPMVGGIYTADPETLSLQATFPKFREMERRYGSIVRGLRAREHTQQGVSGPRYGLFLSLRGGMQVLIDQLREELDDSLHSGKKLERLEKNASGWKLVFRDGSCEEADGVCIALPAWEASRVLSGVEQKLAEVLQSIDYEDAVTINFAFKSAACPNLPRGAGFVIPKIEGLPLVGVTIANQKFEGRVPSDSILLRCFMGGFYHREVLKCSDSELEQLACETLRKILSIQALPRQLSFSRYRQAMPQFKVGHLNKVSVLREQINSCGGLFLTGNYLSGVGIPDCIHEAQKTADTMVNFIQVRGL